LAVAAKRRADDEQRAEAAAPLHEPRERPLDGVEQHVLVKQVVVAVG